MSLDAIGIACKDPQKSIAFYELLGISFKEYGPGHHEGQTASGVRIMLDSFEMMKQINPAWQEPVASGVMLCFKQDSTASVDELYAKVTAGGFVSIKQPWDAFWGQRYASVQDPDGNQIDLFAPLSQNNP